MREETEDGRWRLHFPLERRFGTESIVHLIQQGVWRFTFWSVGASPFVLCITHNCTPLHQSQIMHQQETTNNKHHNQLHIHQMQFPLFYERTDTRNWYTLVSNSSYSSPFSIVVHSHTLENKSSLPPPNPPAGLFCVLLGLAAVVVCVVVVGAALLQPPKSSSCATCGAPQLGLLGGACDVVAVVAGWLGAGEAQTSLLPQASMLEKPE
jgi:hypothetical protein